MVKQVTAIMKVTIAISNKPATKLHSEKNRQVKPTKKLALRKIRSPRGNFDSNCIYFVYSNRNFNILKTVSRLFLRNGKSIKI